MVVRGDTVTGLVAFEPGRTVRAVGRVQNVFDASFFAQLRSPINGQTYNAYFDLNDEAITWVIGDQSNADLTPAASPVTNILYVPDIDSTGVALVGIALSQFCADAIAGGSLGIDGGGGTYNIADTFSIPPRTQTRPFCIRNCNFVGTAASFAGVLEANLAVVGVGPADPTYRTKNWTQTLYAGMDTLLGVADAADLTTNDVVFLRLGADPTDAGFYYECFLTELASVTPTGGGAANLTIKSRITESPMYPLPAYNINGLRQGNKHDLIKVLGFQDNIRIENCTFNGVLVAPQCARNLVIDQPYVKKGSGCFTFFGTHGARIVNPYVEEVAGKVQGSGPFSNYGWFLVNNQTYGTVVENLVCKNFHAAQGILGEEAQSRGTHLKGITKITFNDQGAYAGICGGIQSTPYSTGRIKVDHLIVEGSGSPYTTPNVVFDELDILGVNSGDPLLPQVMTVLGDQVQSRLRYRGQEYNCRKVLNGQLLAPIPVNGTKDFALPFDGTIRNMRLFTSTLTGVTAVQLVRGAFVTSILPELLSGTWAQPNPARTLSFSGPNYWEALTDKIKVRVTTSGSFPVGGYFTLDTEMWTASGDVATSVYADSSFPLAIAGNGAPSLNAQMIGQTYTDVGSGVVYTAKATGTGASDWY